MEKAASWDRLSTEEVADCRVFRVRRDESVRNSDGKEGSFFVIEAPDWVNIIAVTEGREIVMIDQFRHGTEELNLELPGGVVDPGEDPLAAARRELLEETGYSGEEWIRIGGSRPNPAIQNNTIYHYLALVCRKTAEASLDPNESIMTRLVGEDSVDELILRGKITQSLVAAAFLYYRLYKEQT